MAGTITTGSFAKALWPGVKNWYGMEYARWPELWRQMFDVENSTQAWEEDVSEVGFGNVPIKDEGDAISYDTAEQGYTTRYVNTTYGLGFIVSREAFEDDQYGVVGRRRSRALAKSVANTLNILGAAIFNNSGTAGWTGGDGATLVSNTHTHVSGGSFDNKSSSTFSESALEAAHIAVRKWTDDRGLRVGLQTQKLLLPVDLEFDAERILTSALRVGTANNDINALRSSGKFPGGYVVNPYITGTTSWYIATDVMQGFKCYMRRSPQFGTDNDFDTENAKFKSTFRCSFGWTDPRCVYGYDAT